MGAAKRRGNYEARVVQAIERERLAAIKREEDYKVRRAAHLKAEQEARFEQARKEGIPPVLVAGGGAADHTRALILAATVSGLLATRGRR